jgi:hypothetical protein
MIERVYSILPATEIHKINFFDVMEDSVDTLRFSLDKTKTFVKWKVEEEPPFIKEIVGADGPYSHSEILAILGSDEWTDKSTFPILG